MTLLFIRATNSEYHARDDGAEYDRPESALRLGVQSAMAMAADEIAQGQRSSAIEIIVETHDGNPVLRSVLAVSVSPLMTTEAIVVPFPTPK